MDQTSIPTRLLIGLKISTHPQITGLNSDQVSGSDCNKLGWEVGCNPNQTHSIIGLERSKQTLISWIGLGPNREFTRYNHWISLGEISPSLY